MATNLPDKIYDELAEIVAGNMIPLEDDSQIVDKMQFETTLSIRDMREAKEPATCQWASIIIAPKGHYRFRVDITEILSYFSGAEVSCFTGMLVEKDEYCFLPRILIQGMYEGHLVTIDIFLEPYDTTKA